MWICLLTEISGEQWQAFFFFSKVRGIRLQNRFEHSETNLNNAPGTETKYCRSSATRHERKQHPKIFLHQEPRQTSVLQARHVGIPCTPLLPCQYFTQRDDPATPAHNNSNIPPSPNARLGHANSTIETGCQASRGSELCPGVARNMCPGAEEGGEVNEDCRTLANLHCPKRRWEGKKNQQRDNSPLCWSNQSGLLPAGVGYRTGRGKTLSPMESRSQTAWVHQREITRPLFRLMKKSHNSSPAKTVDNSRLNKHRVSQPTSVKNAREKYFPSPISSQLGIYAMLHRRGLYRGKQVG